MAANLSRELVAQDSASQEIGGHRVITFGGCPRISGGARVGYTHIRIMKLRRILCEVTSLESFKVRPLKPSSSPVTRTMNQTELYH
jgi:hypothetical protein